MNSETPTNSFIQLKKELQQIGTRDYGNEISSTNTVPGTQCVSINPQQQQQQQQQRQRHQQQQQDTFEQVNVEDFLNQNW